jgi:hypothetical protein
LGSANVRSAGGVTGTATRGWRVWRIVGWLRRCAVRRWWRSSGCWVCIATSTRGFTVKHFHEQLGKRHHYTLGYTVTKVHLYRASLVQATKRSTHRKKRPQRPMVEMLLHQDASTHAWLPGDARTYYLVVTMEDATSAIYSAFLVDQEGTASSFSGVRDVLAKHGLFCSLYTGRAATTFYG